MSHIADSLPEQLSGIWRRRKWLLLLSFTLVFPAGLSLVLALPPLYRASTTLLMGQGDIAPALVNAASDEAIATKVDVLNKALLSRVRLQELIDRFGLYPQLRQKLAPETVIERMRRDIVLKQETAGTQWDRNPTLTMTLSYQSTDAQLAAAVTNELATLYDQENAALRQQRSARTAAFLAGQLDDVGHKLQAQEAQLREFRDQHLGELPEQQGLSLTTLERTNAELRLNGEKQIQLLNRRDLLMADMVASGVPVSGASGQTRLELLRRQLAELRTQYTEKHPEIVRLKQEVARLEAAPVRNTTAKDSVPAGVARQQSELDRITRDLGELSDQQKSLQGGVVDLQHKIQSTPATEQELLQLNHEYDAIRDQQLTLQKRYQEARLAESLEQQQQRQFQVLEPAIPPNAPVAPKRLLLIIASVVLSLGVSGAIAMVAEQLDTSFHTLQDLRAFTSLRVLGSIGRIETVSDKLQHGFRLLGCAIGTSAMAALLAVLAHSAGIHGEPLVWLLANRGL